MRKAKNSQLAAPIQPRQFHLTSLPLRCASHVAAKSTTGFESPKPIDEYTVTISLLAVFLYPQHGQAPFYLGGRVGGLVPAGSYWPVSQPARSPSLRLRAQRGLNLHNRRKAMPTAQVIQLDDYRPHTPAQPPKPDLKERIKQVLSEATLVETQEKTASSAESVGRGR